MRRVAAVAAALALCGASAHAHGLWGHVHVTGWAVENMPDDELRAFLLDDPQVFNALLFGAVFPDTGYARDVAASRAYAEHTHWEPFVEDAVAWIRANDPPPWDTLESRKRVAFVLGCASHGLQDSIFDSLFLHQVEERDGAGQDETDPGTDGFLVLDGHIRFVPERDVPLPMLLELYASLPEAVTAEVIDASVGLTVAAYVNDEIGLDIAAGFGERYAPEMPWGREHYLDPDVPGSLRSEIYPTMRYQQAVFARLRGALAPDDVAVWAYPEPPRRLRSGDPSTADSWVTLIFGAGVRYEANLAELLDDRGEPVAFAQANSRWGPGHTRLIRLQPREALAPGGWYRARMRPGAALIDGRATSEAWELSFQVDCASDGDPACPDLGPVDVASITGIPEVPEAPDSAEERGCGCRVAPIGASLWLGLLAIVGARRRR